MCLLFLWESERTWFGYNLQAELHCAVRLYSLIEEAVVRVELKIRHTEGSR